jgi:Raf kinase inhibitor-like YbhB/YbcL family protein
VIRFRISDPPGVTEDKEKIMRVGLLTIGTILLSGSVGLAAAQAPPAQGATAKPPALPGLTLTTPAFPDGGIIPPQFTQSDPKAVSPRLEWTNVPAGTVSFVLILHDPDVAMKRTIEDVLHWMVINIPGTARELPENVPATAQLPDGTIQPKNMRGAAGYMGPGAGAQGPYHHYTFELFALDIKLDLGAEATRADVLKAIDGHILGKGVLVGRFHR